MRSSEVCICRLYTNECDHVRDVRTCELNVDRTVQLSLETYNWQYISAIYILYFKLLCYIQLATVIFVSFSLCALRTINDFLSLFGKIWLTDIVLLLLFYGWCWYLRTYQPSATLLSKISALTIKTKSISVKHYWHPPSQTQHLFSRYNILLKIMSQRTVNDGVWTAYLSHSESSVIGCFLI